MTLKDVLFNGAAIGVLILSVVLVHSWSEWRKRTLTAAAEAFGFRRLAKEEALPIVLVPLIDRPGRKFSVILQGMINGYEAAFFDPWMIQSRVPRKMIKATVK